MRVDSDLEDQSAGKAKPESDVKGQGTSSGEWRCREPEQPIFRHDPVVARWLFFFGYLIILDRESAR
jgi:hypothetical protein